MAIIVSHRNWQSEPATPLQKSFLRRHKLATEAEIINMTKGEASNLIDSLKKNGKFDDSATDAQINLIKRLSSRLGENGGQYLSAGMTKADASKIINELKTMGDPQDTDLSEGMYMLEGDIFKLKRNGLGTMYALKLLRMPESEHVSNGVRTHRFRKSALNLSRLSAENLLTREQAEKFGQDFNTCIRCGTVLDPNITNEDGSKRWIGPICETKMGWAPQTN